MNAAATAITEIETTFARAKGTWTGRTWPCDGITPEMSDEQIVRAYKRDDGLMVTSWGYVNADARDAHAFRVRCQRTLGRLVGAEGAELAAVCEDLRALARVSDVRVARDAASAAECAEAAVEAARVGDWSEARRQAEQAAAIERAYGTTPTWGALFTACQTAEATTEDCA